MRPAPPQGTMGKYLQRSQKEFTSTISGAQDTNPRIDLLAHVSRDLRFRPFHHPKRFSSGHRKARPRNPREAGSPPHVEEACWKPRTAARFHDANGEY